MPACYTLTLAINPSSGDLTRVIALDATALDSMVADRESNQGCTLRISEMSRLLRSAVRPLGKFYSVFGTSAVRLSQENSVSRSPDLA